MKFSIQVKTRPQGKADELRATGIVPGVVYGGDRTGSVAVAMGYREFDKLYNEAGESSLIDFQVEGEPETVKVLIQDVQYDPVKGRVTHVDFRQIKMNVVMTATVKLAFVGESSAVKELGGTLVKAHDSVSVKCLPKDLVSEIEVDLSVLKDFDISIHVSDLKLPSGITVADAPEMVVAKVSPPLTEEQLKAMEETKPVNIADVEVEKKGKQEEGADAAAPGATAEKK